jgi:hypothetical protein
MIDVLPMPTVHVEDHREGDRPEDVSRELEDHDVVRARSGESLPPVMPRPVGSGAG